jgi:hypothetical protein
MNTTAEDHDVEPDVAEDRGVALVGAHLLDPEPAGVYPAT